MQNTFLLNHMTFPNVTPIDLPYIGEELGFRGVELRNDTRSGDPLDGFSGAELRGTADSSNQVIFSIKALQHCNDGSIGPIVLSSLQPLAETARMRGVRAL